MHRHAAHAAHIGSSGGFLSGFSTSASVVKTIPAMEPAFCKPHHLSGVNDPSRNQVFKFAGSSVVAGVEIPAPFHDDRAFDTSIIRYLPQGASSDRPTIINLFFVVQAVF